MADCVERESVYNLLTSMLNDIYDDTEHSTEFTSGFEQALRCVTDRIADIPVSDFRLEKHGEWNEEEIDCDFSKVSITGICISRCSLCGHIALEKRSNYCHYCGAKMGVESGG